MRFEPHYAATRKQPRRGFTLVEMIIAIMIYGIVLAAGIGFVFGLILSR